MQQVDVYIYICLLLSELLAAVGVMMESILGVGRLEGDSFGFLMDTVQVKNHTSVRAHTEKLEFVGGYRSGLAKSLTLPWRQQVNIYL